MFNREETMFKITECANELHSLGDYDLAKTLLQVIEDLSSTHCLDEPDEAIALRKTTNQMRREIEEARKSREKKTQMNEQTKIEFIGRLTIMMSENKTYSELYEKMHNCFGVTSDEVCDAIDLITNKAGRWTE